MKLLKWTSTAIVLCGLAGAPAAAQDAPAQSADGSQQTAATTQPSTQPATQPVRTLDVPWDQLTPEQQREKVVEEVQRRMELPPQADTGVNSPNWFVPQSASTTAPSTDGVLAYINFVTVFFTVLILALMIYFVIRYRKRHPDEPDPENVATHSTTLELTWTVIPTCIVLVMFALGFRDFLGLAVAPPNAYRIDVTARMWSWQFTYPNGRISSDLHLPANQPVVFYLQSQDVLHSFFVPAFRIKKDVVPGRFNNLWVEATEPGIFDLYCTEYCGTNHSRMVAKCFVYPPERYTEALEWMTNIYVNPITGEPLPPEQVGLALYEQRGCVGCHSTDGSIRQAPTWKDLYGATRTFVDGSTRIADDEYIRQSILQPANQLVVGFGASMPSYAGQMDDRDINSIIAYIRSLSTPAKQINGETVSPAESQSLPPGGDAPQRD